MDGGVFGLLGLIRLHRGAVEYDLRQRFQLGLRDVGTIVSIFEVARLVVILRNDPSSMIAAAMEGWEYPLSREGWMMADLIDVQGSSKAGKKWKAYDKRPLKASDGVEKKRRGNAAGRTGAQVIEILREYGHGAPV